MKILFIGKRDVDLFETLLDSETSRIILRFYAPRRHPGGVEISVSSLGIALSLVSELRWYVRRYMNEVLFELTEDVYGTHTLAKEVYEREIRLKEAGIRKSLYGIREGKIDRIEPSSDGNTHHPSPIPSDMGTVLEVWSLEEETDDLFTECEITDESDENHLREGL